LARCYTHDAAMVQVVIAATDDADPEVRRSALNCLGIVGLTDREQVPYLIKGLKDQDIHVQCTAGCGFHEIDPMEGTDGIPALIETLDDKNSLMRYRAAHALTLMAPKSRAAVPALYAKLDDPEEHVREWVIQAIAYNEPNERKTALMLVAAVQDKSLVVRVAAIRAMGEIHADLSKCVPAVIAMLDANDDESRWFAAETLGKIGPASAAAIPKMIAILQNQYWDNFSERAVVARALGKMGPQAEVAIPILLTMLNDKQYLARIAAAEALGALGGQSHLKPLKQALAREKKEKQPGYEDVVPAIEQAIAAIRSRAH
jgi:HEAT repeat protein